MGVCCVKGGVENKLSASPVWRRSRREGFSYICQGDRFMKMTFKRPVRGGVKKKKERKKHNTFGRGDLGRVARQRPSPDLLTADVAESPPVFVQLSPDALDVPDWVTTSAVQSTFWENGFCLIVSAIVASLYPNRCSLGGGRVGLGRCRATQSRFLCFQNNMHEGTRSVHSPYFFPLRI